MPRIMPEEQICRLAFLFPGQGMQHPRMLASVRGSPLFTEYYDLICELTTTNIAREIDRDNSALLRENRYSSLLTVLVSALALERLTTINGQRPSVVAGYSVGQWTAMHAAGMLSFAALATAVHARATCMDAGLCEAASGMLSVLGLTETLVETVVSRLREDGHEIYLSNLNCPGNYTLAGTLPALAVAKTALASHGPKRLVAVPVSGAWHCPLLSGAERLFASYLSAKVLRAPTIPVMDNVTGEWLPLAPQARDRRLVEHLTSPVRWQACIEHCIAMGCNDFIEVGFGRGLTTMGFFINRGVSFRSFDGAGPLAREGAGLKEHRPSLGAGV